MSSSGPIGRPWRTGTALLLLFIVPLAQATPKIQHWQSKQGVRVYLVEAPELPMLDVRVIWDAGSVRDGQQAGLAALTAGMLHEGAGGLDADRIGHEFESTGAVFHAGVSRDSATANLRTLTSKEPLRQALHNFKRVLNQPDFPADALQRQVKNTLLGIEQGKQSPGTVAKKAFYASLYGAHPYAMPPEGTEQSLPTIRRRHVVDFYRKYYVAKNAVLVMVGNINKEQATFIAAALFADLSEGERAAALPAVQKPPAAQNVFIAHPSEQTHVMTGQPVVRRGDPDYFPLYVGNHVLGGGGMVSRLFEEVRESRGLSYSVYSYFFPLREAGPFLANLQTKKEQADEARAVLIENIRAFSETGPNETELIAAKKNITGGFPLKIDSNANILEYVAMIAFYTLPLDYLDSFNDKINAVTSEQIREAFQRRLDLDALVTIMVGGKPGATDDGA